jgi:cytochrome oxidase assembly protein ShyY1
MSLIRLGTFEWKLRLWSAGGTILILVAFVALGVWQIDRAHEKEQIISAQKRAAKAPPVNLGHWLAAGKPLSALYLHHVSAAGQVMKAHVLLQDDQTRHNQVGYHLWVPVKLNTSGRVVLINRGWLPERGDRRLPKRLPTMPDSGVFTGVLRHLPRSGLNTNASGCSRGGWPKIVLYPRHSNLTCLFSQPLLDGIVRLDNGSPGALGGLGYKPAQHGLSPIRHYGYAFQWFVMGIAMLVIYIVLNIHHREDI